MVAVYRRRITLLRRQISTSLTVYQRLMTTTLPCRSVKLASCGHTSMVIWSVDRAGADHPELPLLGGGGTAVKGSFHGVKGALKGPYW